MPRHKRLPPKSSQGRWQRKLLKGIAQGDAECQRHKTAAIEGFGKIGFSFKEGVKDQEKHQGIGQRRDCQNDFICDHKPASFFKYRVHALRRSSLKLLPMGTSRFGRCRMTFLHFMRAAGYTDVERGERGSTRGTSDGDTVKVQAEQQRLEAVTGQVAQAEQSLEDAKSATEKRRKKEAGSSAKRKPRRQRPLR